MLDMYRKHSKSRATLFFSEAYTLFSWFEVDRDKAERGISVPSYFH